MNIQRKLICSLFFMACLSVKNSFAQTLPDSTIQKIDSLFQKWNNTLSPGCTVGIVMNDQLIFSKGYGMANLEYGIPNTPKTIYHMASVSKQFTAYSIVLLAKQGKLSLDDDIHKYLPWFPDLKEKITIRNLLNHTSGIRDQWQLLAIGGTRLDDVITQEQIIKVLSKQQALNFKPGEKYTYSNSGFTMLAEIVKAVSGQTLRQFSDSAIFKPLGMDHTHFHDNYTEIEKNRAYSYDRIDSAHFANSVLSYSNDGATSLFTNIPDMSKWVMNFYDIKVGNQTTINELTRNGMLNNGEKISYAEGIVTDTYQGWREFTHSGSDAGFRTNFSVFPDLKMGIMVFSNLGDLNPVARTHQIADLFLKDTTQTLAEINKAPRDSMAAVLKDPLPWKKFMGSYISDEGLVFKFELKGSRIYYHVQDDGDFLIKELNDSFSMPNSPENKFIFSIHAKDTIVHINVPDDQVYELVKFSAHPLYDDAELKTYTGTYYCPELDCKYGIVLKDHALVLTNVKYDDTKLTLSSPDDLISDYWWMNHLKITRDATKKVTGFEVNSGRVMHLKFIKIK